jgi:hypothetical protein
MCQESGTMVEINWCFLMSSLDLGVDQLIANELQMVQNKNHIHDETGNYPFRKMITYTL